MTSDGKTKPIGEEIHIQFYIITFLGIIELHCCFVDDFKPASVDSSQMSAMSIGENNSVTVTVPHVEV